MTDTSPVEQPLVEIERQLAQNTIRYYRTDWKQYRAWCATCAIDPYDVDDAVPVAFIEFLHATFYDASTINRKLSVMRQMYQQWLVRGLVQRVPKISSVKVEPKPCCEPAVFVPPAPTGDANSALRVQNLAIQALAAYEKLSPGQLRCLNAVDIDFEAGVVQVQSRKHSNPVYISESTLRYVKRWLAVRKLLGVEDCALFVSLHWTTGRSVPRTRMSVRALHNVITNGKGKD